MSTQMIKPVYNYVKNDDMYLGLGNSKYKNLRTGKEGEVDDDKAKSVFTINSNATELLNEYPLLSEAIQKLNLKFHNP